MVVATVTGDDDSVRVVYRRETANWRIEARGIVAFSPAAKRGCTVCSSGMRLGFDDNLVPHHTYALASDYFRADSNLSAGA